MLVSVLQWICLFHFVHFGQTRMPLKPAWNKALRKSTPGCKLGGKFYELEEKWSPELEPVGVMFCVKCQCLPVIKKGVLSQHGKVECRNIKNQCPEPQCDNPELKPGMCCKSCPGDGHEFEDIYKGQKLTDFEKTATLQGDVRGRAQHSEFSALLVGRHVRKGVKTRAVAWGRFSIERNTLVFSVLYSRMKHLRYIRFIERDGTILHEQKIHPRSDGKKMICGVWSKLASVYKDILNRGHISVVLTTGQKKHGEISGRIVARENPEEETFISLLNPSKKDGSGGVVMMNYDPKRKEAKFELQHSEIIDKDSDPAFIVSIHKGKKLMFQSETDGVKQGDSLFMETWTGITKGQAKQLARRKLSFRVTTSQGKVLKGKIMPRQSCGTFQAVLSGSLSLAKSSTGAAGAAVVSLMENGKLEYKIRLNGLSSKVVNVGFERVVNRKNKRKRVADVTADFIQDKDGFGGWVNGTFRKMKSIDTVSFLNGKTFINVATENFRKSEIRGHVTELGFRPHTKKPGEFPIILMPKGIRPEMTSGTAGNAWFGFDRNCVLHYEIVVEGVTVKKGSTIAAQLSVPPTGGEIPVLSNRHSVKTFGGFSGNKAVGEVKKISEDLYTYLDQGHAVLQLASMSQPLGELRGNVTVRNTCWRLFGDHDSNMLVDEEGNPIEEVPTYTCDYEGTEYEDGASWIPDVGSMCNTCSCKRGKVKCHKEVCPVLNCPSPVKIPGQCCPSCPVVGMDSPSLAKNESCYFSGDKRWHPAGAAWHPYIPPFGYVTCAVCNCVPGGEVTCNKITCPVLDCPDSVAIRKNEMDCCKVCPTYSPDNPKPAAVVDVGIQSIQGDRSVTGEDTFAGCKFAGKRYANGANWHPLVKPFGIMKCITCQCIDGESECKRVKCPRLRCPKSQQVPGSCCPKCVGEENAESRPKRSVRKKVLLEVLTNSKIEE